MALSWNPIAAVGDCRDRTWNPVLERTFFGPEDCGIVAHAIVLTTKEASVHRPRWMGMRQCPLYHPKFLLKYWRETSLRGTGHH